MITSREYPQDANNYTERPLNFYKMAPNAPKSRPIQGGYYPHTKSDTGMRETPNIARPG